MGSTRNRSRSPVGCPYEATWRKQKMQELGVRWALRQHIKSFHALENVRSSLDGLVRRYSKKTQKWIASGNTDSILQHAAHVAAWVVLVMRCRRGGGGQGYIPKAFERKGFPERVWVFMLRDGTCGMVSCTATSDFEDRADGIEIAQCVQ